MTRIYPREDGFFQGKKASDAASADARGSSGVTPHALIMELLADV